MCMISGIKIKVNNKLTVMAGTEVKFANRLGSNEPTVRNRAIKALRKWISARSASSQSQWFWKEKINKTFPYN